MDRPTVPVTTRTGKPHGEPALDDRASVFRAVRDALAARGAERREDSRKEFRLVKKLVDGPGFNHLIEGRHGYVLFNVNDRYVGRSIEEYGEWGPGETELFQRLVHAGDYVIDAGAHIGAHTLAFSRLVGRQGKVFAFEPQRLLYQILAANVALNSLANVYTYQMGIGDKSGSLWLADDLDYAREANFGGIPLRGIFRTLEHAGPKYRLPVVRLDDFYDQPRLDLLKIDVEGMEVSVLRGAERAIRRHRPIIYAENDRKENSSELGVLLRNLGYRLQLAPAASVFSGQLVGEQDGSVPRDRVDQHALHP